METISGRWNLPQQEALNFAGLRLGQCVDDRDLARRLVPPAGGPDQLDDLVGQLRRPGRAGPQHDERLDRLAAQRVGHADGRRLRHRAVPEDGAFDLERPDAIAGAFDDVVGAALEPEIAVGVATAEIAGAGPAAALQRRGRRRVVPVAQEIAAVVVGVLRDQPASRCPE